MHYALRDWDRSWYLSRAMDAGRRAPSAAFFEPASIRRRLSRLLEDACNRDVVRNLLATVYPGGPVPVPTDIHGLMRELERLLARCDFVLAEGPAYDRRNVGARGEDAAARTEEMEVWNFTPAEETGQPAPDPHPDEALPSLRFSVVGEDPFPFRFSHGADRQPALSLAHASEGGSALGLSHAAEGAYGMAHRAEIRPSP